MNRFLMSVLGVLLFGMSLQASQVTGELSVTTTSYSRAAPMRLSGTSYIASGATLANAKAFDFTNTVAITPGIDGDVALTAATGDFVPYLALMQGKVKDFSFFGPGTASYSYPAGIIFTVGNFLSVRLNSIVVAYQSLSALVLSGDVTIYMNGRDPTSGTFSISSNKVGTILTFTAVPTTNQ